MITLPIEGMIGMNHEEIAALVKRIQNGDEGAFHELYELFYQRAYYFALKLTASDANAKDVVQDTFIQITKSIHNLEDPKSFQAWMNRILISKAHKLFEKEKFKTVDYEEPSILKNLIVHSGQDGKKFGKKVDQEILLQLLDSMKPKHREVLVLVYLGQYKLQEISQMLNVPLSTVKSRIGFGKNELKELVERYERLNDYKFTFRTSGIGAALSSAFAAEAGVIASVGGISWGIAANFSKLSSFFGSNAVALTTAIAIGGVVLTGAMYQRYASSNSSQQQELPNTSQQANRQEIVYEKEAFPLVEHKGKQYATSKDAYFRLVDWANTLSQLQSKETTDIEQMKPFYTSLKSMDNEYYHMLVKLGYSEIFETE